jgi:DNA-binding transcriptional regulator YiaG
MPTRTRAEIADLVRAARQRLDLTQTQLAQYLGVSYQSVNCWKNRQSMPLPMALKLIEAMLRQISNRGKDLLARYFLVSDLP